jgi:hypothetical protein
MFFCASSMRESRSPMLVNVATVQRLLELARDVALAADDVVEARVGPGRDVLARPREREHGGGQDDGQAKQNQA